jgi:hypothetical protein
MYNIDVMIIGGFVGVLLIGFLINRAMKAHKQKGIKERAATIQQKIDKKHIVPDPATEVWTGTGRSTR